MCEYCDCKDVINTFENDGYYHAESHEALGASDYQGNVTIAEEQERSDSQSYFLIESYFDAYFDELRISYCPVCGRKLTGVDHRKENNYAK